MQWNWQLNADIIIHRVVYFTILYSKRVVFKRLRHSLQSFRRSARRGNGSTTSPSAHRRAQSEGPVSRRAGGRVSGGGGGGDAGRVRRVDHDEIRPTAAKSTLSMVSGAGATSKRSRASSRKV
jgi:hypothetical protein